jgi:alkylresorcinol/alkylpyrone synthase
MSKILAIGTAVPEYKLPQMQIHAFMENLYNNLAEDKRKLRVFYERTGINYRYSAIPDYNVSCSTRVLFPQTSNLEPFPSLEKRMELYHAQAAPLAVKAVHNLGMQTDDVTHLITVSCTGLSAPGLDLELMTLLNLPNHTDRTSVNFMGSYAAVHALKQAHAICKSTPSARVLIVCVELCTLHFQKTNDYDNITANAIFADGAAACLVVGDDAKDADGLQLKNFYSEVHSSGKNDMAWQLSSSGFLMTLSNYIPQLVEMNIAHLMTNALTKSNLAVDDIKGWAIHPGGRKILEVIGERLGLTREQMGHSYDVLGNYGNMSSATILFVLKQMMSNETITGNVFGVAFGPGLTMETFVAFKS